MLLIVLSRAVCFELFDGGWKKKANCQPKDDMLAGSKVSLTSIIHMTWELAAILIAYRWLKIWNIRSLAEINKQ